LVGVINLKTHFYVVKLPTNDKSGLRFHFEGTQGDSAGLDGIWSATKKCFLRHNISTLPFTAFANKTLSISKV
jgi:hypothetical protein